MTLAADGEESQKASVTCESGDADPCGALALTDFEPVPADIPCTEIYGGPDVATIEGTVAGKPVSARFTRSNGCEIERFDRVLPLLEAEFPGYVPGASLR